MNKKIKIIDLVNMQYKNEKMPKNIRIKYAFVFDYYTYNEQIKWYETADKTSILDVFQKLDYEVEILEDNIEEIEEKSNFEDMGYEIAQAYFEFYKGIAKALTEKRKESEDK